MGRLVLSREKGARVLTNPTPGRLRSGAYPRFTNPGSGTGMIFLVGVLPSADMEDFSVAEAAAYLGMSKEAVHKAVRENRLRPLPDTEPVRLAGAAVEEFHRLKQQALVASLARGGETPVSVARRVRRGLSESETGLPRPFSAKLSAMPEAWRSLFNRAELAAACVPDGEGCRWCKAGEFGAVLGLRPVEYAPAFVELFGGEPCGECGPGLLRPFMAALRSRVHRGRERPSAPAPAPSAAERELARQWAARRPVTASARPQQDDDGRSMVQRRLRESRAQLTAAKRRGDQRHAIQLRQTIQALESDAAAIDGRASRGRS